MIATEAGVDAIDLLESIREPRGGQFIRSEPPAEIGEGSCDRRKGDADQCKSCQRVGSPKARPLDVCWCSKIARHGPLQSKSRSRSIEIRSTRNHASLSWRAVARVY